jgi:hypothetical protein
MEDYIEFYKPVRVRVKPSDCERLPGRHYIEVSNIVLEVEAINEDMAGSREGEIGSWIATD